MWRGRRPSCRWADGADGPAVAESPSRPRGERAQGGAKAAGAGWPGAVVAPAGFPVAQLVGGVDGELGAQGAGDVPAVAERSAGLAARVLHGEFSRPARAEARGEHRPVLGRFTGPL